MKKLVVLFIIASIWSCGTSKKAESNLNIGDYDAAIKLSTEALAKGKDKKANQKHIPILEQAFAKANVRDLAQIKALKKNNDSDSWKQAFDLYVKMNNRKAKIQALLPLYITEQQRNARFDLKDYTNDIISTKNTLSEKLYQEGKSLLYSGNISNARKAYDKFNYLDLINSGYKDVRNLITQAKDKGTTYIFAKVVNKTGQTIPKQLEDDILNFGSFGLTNNWLVFHTKKDYSKQYTKAVDIELNQVVISADQENTQLVKQEKRVKDGQEYVLDQKGNVMKDSLGNDIKRDKIITVRAEVKLFQQLKTAKITGKVNYKNYNTNASLGSYPVLAEAKFENIYAKYRGDQRAIEQKYYEALQKKPVEKFPTDEEIIMYTSKGLQNKIKEVLNKYPLE
jgi:hypothetical protein